MESLMIPSSIQRIRAFLIEMCGMKVKPWASTEETLAALATTLLAKQGCDIFWTSLRVLLKALARDLKARQVASPGTLLDNEVLDGERYAALLDEIRAALARQIGAKSDGAFRGLASALSASALGLLLLLGGAATVGCADSPMHQSTKVPDAATPDAVTTDLTAPLAPDAKSPPRDGMVYITFPDAFPDVPPDTQPPPNAPTGGPDGGLVTIEDIMVSCNLPSYVQAGVLACLARLRESWSTGMAQDLAGVNCAAVASNLSCFTSSVACAFGTTNDYVSGTTRICEPIIIYAGVRFV
jgi:hypothetical protein